MKKLLVLISLLFTILSYSQNKENFDFEAFSNPNTKNELSLYFKEKIPKKLLKKVTFYPKKNNAILSFSINKEKKPYNIKINNSRNTEFKNAIFDAFKEYPLEKLKIDSLNSKNRYHLQLISKEKNKVIFNCSSKIMVEVAPVINNCNNLGYYEDLKDCFNLQVMQHFYDTANFNLLEISEVVNQANLTEEKDIELNLFNEVDLFLKFSVSENGKLINKKSEVPTIFKEEIERVFNSFPQVATPSTFNNEFYSANHSFTIPFKKGEKTVYIDVHKKTIDFTKPTTENELSKFFVDKLSQDFIEIANLNSVNNNLAIYFELDIKNKPFNITTNSRSAALSDEIIAVFKQYSLDKLTFADKGKFNKYRIQILSFTDDAVIVNADSVVGYMKFPVFEGCENSKDIDENKKCFSQNIQRHFSEKFNADLPNKLGLSPGRLRILISFKINKNGQIAKIRTKLSQPSPEIDFEAKRVVSTLPKMQSTQIHNDKVENIKFSFPFTLIVQ